MSFQEKTEKVIESFSKFLSIYENSTEEKIKNYREKFKKYLDELSSSYGAVIKDSHIEKEFNMEGEIRPDSGENAEAKAQIKKLVSACIKQFPKLKSIEKPIVSGYRSYEYQVKNFGGKVKSGRSIDDVQKANTLPGFSQHHTGKAFDIFSVDTDWWNRNSGIKEWVSENAKDYGFKVTYTESGKLRIPEPWHLYYVGEGSVKKDQDDKKGGNKDSEDKNQKGQGEEKLDKETSEKMNKLAEEFKDAEIKFPKKPVPSKGDVSKPSQVLGALNTKLEEKFGEEMKKSVEDEQPPGEEATPGETNKIDTSAEGGAQETPFGKLSDVIADVAAFISGDESGAEDSTSTYLDDEEKEAKELEKKEYTSNKISTYLGLNPDDPDVAKKEVENKKSQKSKPDPEAAKIYDSFPNGGVNRENQEELSKNNMERMGKNKTLAESVKKIEQYPLPKYDSLSGDKSFYGSAEYDLVCKELGIGEKDGGSKFFEKLKSLGLGSKIVKLSEGPFIIFVRPPLAVKNKYGNAFSDIAFLITRENDKLNVFPMMASSTPSPAFMNIEWRNSIAAKIGLRGINFQGTFIIKSSILPSFKLDEASEKSKFYSSKILTCNGSLSKLLGSLPTTPPDGCQITKYDPSYTPPVVGAKVRPSICPSLPKGTSQFLDATTSGDLVIQDFEDYQELVSKVSAAGGSVGVIILNG